MISYRVENAIGLIELDDQATLNALRDDDLAVLSDVVASAGAESDVRAVLIVGAGGTFSVGGHVSKLEALIEAEPLEVHASLAAWQRPLAALERLEKPVIAAIDGPCLAAGAALALACDLRVASPRARISFPSVNVGLVTDLGCSRRLTRIVGLGWAKHCLLTGCWIDADMAARMGLVTAVIADDDFRGASIDFVASQLLPRSGVAQGIMKRLIEENADASLGAALDSERMAQALLYAGDDVREGYRSIVERRSPEFRRAR